MTNYRVPPPPWPDEVWREENDRLTEHVKRWFQEAVGRFAPPTEHGCRLFAYHLFSLACFADDKRRSPRPVIVHGKPFLKHLVSERRVMEMFRRLSKIYETDADRHNKNEALLFRVEEVEQHLKVLLDHFNERPHKKNDFIRFLGELAQELWAETNEGRSPRNKNEGGPLCRLLEPALTSIGRRCTQTTISAALRGRR